MADWLFAQGHAADLILAIMLAELVVLVRFRDWPWRHALLRLMPGALMMVALRAAMTGADWPWIALPLALSFPVHLADILQRSPGRP